MEYRQEGNKCVSADRAAKWNCRPDGNNSWKCYKTGEVIATHDVATGHYFHQLDRWVWWEDISASKEAWTWIKICEKNEFFSNFKLNNDILYVLRLLMFLTSKSSANSFLLTSTPVYFSVNNLCFYADYVSMNRFAERRSKKSLRLFYGEKFNLINWNHDSPSRVYCLTNKHANCGSACNKSDILRETRPGMTLWMRAHELFMNAFFLLQLPSCISSAQCCEFDLQ